MKSGRIDGQGLLRRLQKVPESSGLVNAEGFQVGKVGCTGFTHGVSVISACCDSWLGTCTILSAGGVKVVQGGMAIAIVPRAHGLVLTIGVDRSSRGVMVEVQPGTLQGNTQG